MFEPGPSVYTPVEGRDTQRVPAVVADPRWNEPQSAQQVRRRHRRHDEHREPTDRASRPQQQRLLNSAPRRLSFKCSLQIRASPW